MPAKGRTIANIHDNGLKGSTEPRRIGRLRRRPDLKLTRDEKASKVGRGTDWMLRAEAAQSENEVCDGTQLTGNRVQEVINGARKW